MAFPGHTHLPVGLYIKHTVTCVRSRLRLYEATLTVCVPRLYELNVKINGYFSVVDALWLS